MHPAFSVIAFTVCSGAGFGLLALVSAGAALGLIPADRLIGFVAMGLGLALACGGLLSSTAHLGRPERAWRAFSQWRSSWLSREGVAAVATILAAVALAAGWVFLGRTDGAFAAAGLATAVLSVATVCTTAMIYASLKPIAAWHSPLTLPAYVLFSVMTGAGLLTAVLAVFGLDVRGLAAAAAVLALAGWFLKLAVWHRNADHPGVSTLNSATGLKGGTVRSLEWPHTEENYILKEMGYRIARKHALKLRRIAQALAFALPLVLFALAALVGGNAATVAAVVAAVVQLAGMLVERWLFFAEAKHAVTLYYGR